MTTTLKNGMYVTPPVGVFNSVTYGEKYQISNVETNKNGLSCFNINDDDNIQIFCISEECSHINNLNWKIVEL